MQHTVTNSKGQVFFIAELKDNNILYCQWIGYINDIDKSKEACLFMAKLAKENKCLGILNDNRKQTGPWPPINDWLENTWKPALAAAGIRCFAHIHSENIFTQITANKVLMSELSHGVEFHNFDSETSALDWVLRKQDNTL